MKRKGRNYPEMERSSQTHLLSMGKGEVDSLFSQAIRKVNLCYIILQER